MRQLSWWLVALSLAAPLARAEDTKVRSHPPLRKAPAPSHRPMGKGPARFVDVRRGDDAGEGTQASPWKTITRALRSLAPGETLYLGGGVYREHVRLSLRGRADAPITIRSFPGEQAILDGSLAEFQDAPAQAWEPWPRGSPGEYRSRRAYPNLRNIMGAFGDSMVGLQTYYHAQDLRASNEIWEFTDPKKPRESDVKPVYCGPGLWYDHATGHLHVRLAHTHLPGLTNYQGETDPRQLPLVLAPYHSVPLYLDAASHVRVQDLVIRGGGYDTVILEQARDIEFDNVTVWCGTYGLRVRGTRNLRLFNCGIHGSVPPWTFRNDTSLRSYPGRPHRDITRLGTHALLVPEAGREFSVYALPINADWEIAHCEFSDAHDGLYLGGVSLRFHHNHVHTLHDDGLYLSPMYPRYSKKRAVVEVYQNLFSGCLTALAFGGPESTTDQVNIYRNLVDLRTPVPTGRPRARNAPVGQNLGKVMGDHGSPPWPEMHLYHNTFVMGGPARFADMSTLNAIKPERPRRVFNNAFIHLARLPGLRVADASLCQQDGNLYWLPGLEARRASSFFSRYRASARCTESKKFYPPGLTTNSLVANPRFHQLLTEAGKANDYRPRPGSPLVNAGVPLPAEWQDPLRSQDQGKPDIGALPLGVAMWKVGRLSQPKQKG